MESGWGLSVAGGGVLTPFVGLAQSGEDARNLRLGGRLEVDGFSLELAATRQESGAAAPDHAMALQGTATW